MEAINITPSGAANPIKMFSFLLLFASSAVRADEEPELPLPLLGLPVVPGGLLVVPGVELGVDGGGVGLFELPPLMIVSEYKQLQHCLN